jgi:hypothetical protein
MIILQILQDSKVFSIFCYHEEFVGGPEKKLPNDIAMGIKSHHEISFLAVFLSALLAF